MRTMLCLAAVTSASLGALAAAPQSARPAAANVPTFTKDVAPILYKNCTTCHRPGEIAPMSLLTYEDARPYAKAIRDEVGEGAHAAVARRRAGRYVRKRTQADRRREEDAPRVGGRRRAEGQPEGPAARAGVPARAGRSASRTSSWRCRRTSRSRATARSSTSTSTFPTNFTEPKWVQAIEVRPGNREVVHHVLVHYQAKPDMTRTPVLKFNDEQMRLRRGRRARGPAATARTGCRPRLIATYAPGTNPAGLPARHGAPPRAGRRARAPDALHGER